MPGTVGLDAAFLVYTPFFCCRSIMNWLVLSVLSACMSAVWSLAVKAGLEHAYPESFAALYSTGALIILVVALLATGKKIGVSKWALLAGVFQGIAALGLSLSFAISPNPGYSMGVFRMQAVATALVSHFLFGAPLEAMKVLGMLVACAGVVHLARGSGPVEGLEAVIQRQASGDAAPSKKSPRQADHIRWLWLAAGAGLMMTVKDVATKKALMVGGPGSFPSVLAGAALMQTLVTLLGAYHRNGTLALKSIPGKESKHPAAMVGLAALAFACYQGTVVSASKEAPNVGIVKAIDSLGLVLTTFGSRIFFGSPISSSGLQGVATIIAGVLVMCFSGVESQWWQRMGKSAKGRLCKKHGICASKGYDFKLLDALTGWTTA